MQYMLIFREPSEGEHPRNDPEKAQAYYGAWKAYIGALNQAGVIVGGRGLQPPQTATTVRVRSGQRQVQDGPYPDTKEQLGGYYVLEVDVSTSRSIGRRAARQRARVRSRSGRS